MVSVNTEMFDADPWLFNCLNGTVNLKTGRREPHIRSDMITKIAKTVYDSTAPCPCGSFPFRDFRRQYGLIDYISVSSVFDRGGEH